MLIDHNNIKLASSFVPTPAMQRGIDDWKAGLGYCQNPYPNKTPEHDEWAESWQMSQAAKEYDEEYRKTNENH